MPQTIRGRSARDGANLLLALLLASSSFAVAAPAASAQQPSADASRAAGQTPAVEAKPAAQLFRLETRPVGADAELLTVFGDLDGLGPQAGADTPLVSILRDTLGDDRPENDRLRYVWMLTYTRPSVRRRLASAVPFLYRRVGDRVRPDAREMPPPIIDLAAPERDVWRRFMWSALQNVVLNPYGVVAKASAGTLRRNQEQYRKAHLLRALAVLSLYEAETGASSAFTPEEAREIQARLALADKTFGGLVDELALDRARRRDETQWQDHRGHNWELLRQRAEAEGLYFEPLVMPDGGATHAVVWVAREDLERGRGRKYDKRFLNIADPWSDGRLRRWTGHTETWSLDAESRVVPAGTEGARAVEMIPLALYGLEHPKVPSLLVDFRDGANPKRREMSHRVLEDVTRHVLSFSAFGDLHYFLGRTVLDFVTSRRGMDLNQPSRVRAYSQLKLLLALDATLDSGLREEIERRVERVSLNPLENGLAAEARLARRQYEALVAYAGREGGLAARLDRERRAELVPARHGRAARVLLRFAGALSLGLYEHREGVPRAEALAALDRERSLDYHLRFLREVAKSSPQIEIVWDMEEVRRSLRHVARAGRRHDAGAARLAARLFAQTADEETRRLCLDCLYRVGDETAMKELRRLRESEEVSDGLRLVAARYLRESARGERHPAPEDAKAADAALGQ